MLKLKWCADLKAESDFRAMGMPFAKRSIRLSQIDLVESSRNGARLGDTIIDELVKDYAQGMVNGDTFPSPVVYKSKSGYVLTSGNQRCHAIKYLVDAKEVAKDPMVEVYELETTETMLLEAIARAANVSHGSRTTKAERLTHAVFMVKRYGMRVADVAILYMVSQTAVRAQVRAEEVRKELGKHDIDVSAVGNVGLEKLCRLSKHTRAFAQVGALIAQHNPTIEKITQIVNRVDKARSDSGRIKIVKEVELDLSSEAKSYAGKKTKKTAPKLPTRPRRDKVISTLSKLSDFLDYGNDGGSFQALDELQVVTSPDEDKIRKLWERLKLRMTVLLKRK